MQVRQVQPAATKALAVVLSNAVTRHGRHYPRTTNLAFLSASPIVATAPALKLT